MKKITIVTVLFLMIVSLGNSKGIEFATGDFKTILAKAVKENKLIFIDVYTSWCGPCKLMSKEIFPLESVGDFYNKNFICYKIDAEKGEGPQIKEKYDVRCYPTFLYIAPDGTLKHRFSSSTTAAEFIRKGEVALDNKKNFAGIQQQYEKGKLNTTTMPLYIELLKDAYLDYQRVSNDYFSMLPESELLKPQYTKIIKDYMTSMENPHFKFIVRQWNKFEPILTDDFMDNIVFTSINGALDKKDYVSYKKYMELLQNIPYKNQGYMLAWAEKQYYETIEDWDNFVASGIRYIDEYEKTNWASIWRFVLEFMRDEVFIGEHKKIGLTYAAKAVQLMPNYSTMTAYAQLLYKTGDVSYKNQIIDLYEKAIQYEIDNKTGRDITPEEEFLKKARKMEYFTNKLSPYTITVQPIVARNDEKEEPASMAIPTDLISRVYEKAGIQFNFLAPIYWNNTNVRDGLINLDSICRQAAQEKIFRGTGDMVNMVFVNKADGREGPLGFGMMNGNVTFIALGERGDTQEKKEMQAFVIAHEVGHNLGLQHVVDDENRSNDQPNIMGDGEFCERINPSNSLTPYQINVIRKNPLVRSRIDLLQKVRGEKAILDESFEPWLSKMQLREIESFTGKSMIGKSLKEAKQAFCTEFKNGVIDFTPQEQKLLRMITNKIINTLSENQLQLMAEHSWKFIKTKSDLCGGFAYTVGNCIVLSEKQTQFMTEHAEEEQLLMEQIGKLIVHEQTHVLQRTFADKFDKLYVGEWNFIKSELSSTEEMTLNQVSNPDAPTPQWLIPDSKKTDIYYWPRVLFNRDVKAPKMGTDFIEYAYKVKYNKGDYKLIMKKGEPEKVLLSELKDYTKSFAVTTGLDHPNEISAYLFGDYFIDLLNAKKTTLTEKLSSSQKFTQWIHREFSERR